MNTLLAKTGSVICIVTVVLFAVFMLIPFDFGSYVVCMLLPIGYILMAAGFHAECGSSRKAAASAALVFAAVYAALIYLVYFAQTTTVRLESLSEQAHSILDYKKGGLLFNYDLLGYGMMALSTFFIGLTIQARGKADKWLKGLLLAHGVFFLSCFILPMTGVFAGLQEGASRAGTVALEFWCAYFLAVSILAFRHFGKSPV